MSAAPHACSIPADLYLSHCLPACEWCSYPIWYLLTSLYLCLCLPGCEWLHSPHCPVWCLLTLSCSVSTCQFVSAALHLFCSVPANLFLFPFLSLPACKCHPLFIYLLPPDIPHFVSLLASLWVLLLTLSHSKSLPGSVCWPISCIISACQDVSVTACASC